MGPNGRAAVRHRAATHVERVHAAQPRDARDRHVDISGQMDWMADKAAIVFRCYIRARRDERGWTSPQT